MVSRTVPESPGEECGLGVRWGRALTAWVPGQSPSRTPTRQGHQGSPMEGRKSHEGRPLGATGNRDNQSEQVKGRESSPFQRYTFLVGVHTVQVWGLSVHNFAFRVDLILGMECGGSWALFIKRHVAKP